MSKSLDLSQYQLFYFEDFINKPQLTLKKFEDFLGISNVEYSIEKIQKKVNPSVSKPMPTNFINATKSIVYNEIEALNKSGVNIHNLWEINL
jgi:hypothetical protein